jgi:hypothetical protein
MDRMAKVCIFRFVNELAAPTLTLPRSTVRRRPPQAKAGDKRFLALVIPLFLLVLPFLWSCQHEQSVTPAESVLDPIELEAIDLSDPALPRLIDGPLRLAAARNEWTSFVLRLHHLPPGAALSNFSFRVGEFIDDAGDASPAPPLAVNISIFQVLPMPVDMNRAGYIRHSGRLPDQASIPRALLPIASSRGVFRLSALRDPNHPFNPAGHPAGDAGAPVLLWIDVHVPNDAPAKSFTSTCQILQAGEATPAAEFAAQVNVYDFALPAERNLVMASAIEWEAFKLHYTDKFEAITPRLMHRGDATYDAPLKTIDQLVGLAEMNRVEVVIPRLQPTAKWPAGQPPQVDWSDFDTVVTPWLNGNGFADKVPLGYWPLPAVDYMGNYDPKSQQNYWANAGTHFNRQDWLGRAPVYLAGESGGRATDSESVELSMRARQILDAHPLVKVMLPLEDEQLKFSSSGNASLIDPATVDRLISAATGFVFAAPNESLANPPKHPPHWLRAVAPGLVPYVGAGGSERDVRLWAWLAFLKRASLVVWSDPLPDQTDPTLPSDPSRMVWFYPGSWFGVEGPVSSIQLKWLRHAQEDFEYLKLAEDRGMLTNALMLARLITKQVELQPTQRPDSEYGLLSGAVDEQTWDEARSLVARTILVRPAGFAASDPVIQAQERRLDLDTIRWQQPKERPYILPRATEWLLDNASQLNGDKWAFLRLGIDVYNAGDNRPDQNLLQWSDAGAGWEFSPQPQEIGALRTYWVQRINLEARVDLDRLTPDSRKPLEITYIDGYTRAAYKAQMVLAVAASDRREGKLVIDGKLDDWTDDDLIQDGPLTKMLNRPSVQQWQIEPSSEPAQIYSGWSDDNFYVAFRLRGAAPETGLHRNFIQYDFRRAWGEDLCEVLVQPIYDDNTVGPVTSLACKPNGVCVVKRRLDPKAHSNPWLETDGTAVRYASEPNPDLWTGEIAIPWKLIFGDAERHVQMVRFNFVQHIQSKGESASWAGPIDDDLDDSYMGLLYLREQPTMGMKP